MRAKDRLYKEYSNHKFNELAVDSEAEPELYKFIEETKLQGPKFSNYTSEKLEEFAQRIYELRKN
jgi:glutamate racemase